MRRFLASMRRTGPHISLYTSVHGSAWAWRADIMLNARKRLFPKRRVIEVDRGMISIDGVHWYGASGNSWMILPIGEKP